MRGQSHTSGDCLTLLANFCSPVAVNVKAAHLTERVAGEMQRTAFDAHEDEAFEVICETYDRSEIRQGVAASTDPKSQDAPSLRAHYCGLATLFMGAFTAAEEPACISTGMIRHCIFTTMPLARDIGARRRHLSRVGEAHPRHVHAAAAQRQQLQHRRSVRIAYESAISDESSDDAEVVLAPETRSRSRVVRDVGCICGGRYAPCVAAAAVDATSPLRPGVGGASRGGATSPLITAAMDMPFFRMLMATTECADFGIAGIDFRSASPSRHKDSGGVLDGATLPPPKDRMSPHAAPGVICSSRRLCHRHPGTLHPIGI
ncbi:hypothetical protein CYMTET_39353 [Cymbomonas tetramitiformis]|uniref:Uncharacterized protein n=1 Tax=Cymbomonas tetramitiformis TaxID=36881 RepID=A0AAE0F4L3_9CHLO|nr:hypothetical protein CYMTET_39353 [Cymbomonas tetramitiformis]